MSQVIDVFESLATIAVPVLTDSLLKGSAILCLVTAATFVARGASAAVRHSIWSLGLISCLILPLLSLTLPQWRAPVPWPVAGSRKLAPGAQATGIAASIRHRLSAGSPDSLKLLGASRAEMLPARQLEASPGREWTFAIWLGVATCLTLRLIASRSWLRKCALNAKAVRENRVLDVFREAAVRLGIRDRVQLLVDDHRTVPLAWGVFRPHVLLPAETPRWDAERLQAVLLHELAHIKRHDLLMLVLSRIACAIYWFNPLIWMAAWRLETECERACDDMVLRSGVKASDYAEHLLHVCSALEHQRIAGAAAMVLPSRLEGRLVAVLNGTTKRSGVSRRLVFTLCCVELVIVIPLSTVRGVRAAELPGSDPKTGPSATAPLRVGPGVKAESPSKTNTVAFSGLGTVVPEQPVRVNAKVAGEVIRVRGEAGMKVKAGDLLAELDGTQYRLALQRLRAKVALAEAQLLQAKRLAQTNVVQAEGLKIAEAELKLAELELQSGEYDLANTRVRAPIDGVLLEKQVEVGMMVDPKSATATHLYEMADLRHLVAHVNVVAGTQVVQGQQCVIHYLPTRNGSTLPGEVEIVGTAVKPETGTFQVRVRIEAAEMTQKLKPGALVQVDFLAPD